MDQPHNTVWIRLALPLVMLASMFVIYFPLPAPLMDLLLAANLTLSVVLLMAAVYVRSPLELKIFPSLLLVTTLSRLALNVATTRLILSRGAIDRDGAAGEIIQGFSEFVAGSSLVVGSVIFLILFVIQFVVITKGATRIGEVAARFALDSMPGQQMSIDADLNAGVIDFEEAKRQRAKLRQMADFQGSMDGASKYIRGDAIAGIIIVGINIAGGLIQGMMAGMSLEAAATTFTRLTIGDGLVSQLPALLISIAAGLLITRGSDESDLSADSVRQLSSSPMALWVSAAFVFVLPMANLPALPLWSIGSVLVVVGFLVSKSKQAAKTEQKKTETRKIASEPQLERFLETDQIELQVGAQLLALCNSNAGGTVVSDISMLRRDVALEWGVVLPKVRIRDNLKLQANRFRVLLNGNPVFEAAIETDKRLYIFRRDDFPVQAARATLSWAPYAVWAKEEPQLIAKAIEVLTPAQVIVRSMRWLVREHADLLLTRDAANELVNEVRKAFPRLVEDTIPETITLGQLQRVMRQLLREGIALRPLHVILEAIGESKIKGGEAKDIAAIAREALREHTVQRLKGSTGNIACFGISDELTDSLEDSIQPLDEQTASGKFSANIRRNLRAAVESGRTHLLGLGCEPVLLVPQEIFAVVKHTVSEMHPRVFVLGEHEVANEALINKLAEITPGEISRSVNAA